jgi:hypothetical protein
VTTRGEELRAIPLAAAAIVVGVLSNGAAHAEAFAPGEWVRQGEALLRSLVSGFSASDPEVIVPPANFDPQMVLVPPGRQPPMRIIVPPGSGWRR